MLKCNKNNARKCYHNDDYKAGRHRRRINLNSIKKKKNRENISQHYYCSIVDGRPTFVAHG